MINTDQRTNDPEIMDDFLMEGALLVKALDKIATINRLLGGNSITIDGVKQLLRQSPTGKELKIVDLGCGNGDMLRALARYGQKEKLNLKLTGIDANAFTISHAQSCSAKYPYIDFICGNFMEELETDADIILLTLTLHHFTNEEIQALLQKLKGKAKLGIVINDLHRSKTAYYLFKALCTALQLNTMTRADGLTSILRGFKRNELEQIAGKLQLPSSSIKWKWAYRYQWIISNL